jgi:hypothetical protein
VTLDGVMQAPGGPDEDRDGGFEHGGWSFPYAGDDMGDARGLIDEYRLFIEPVGLGLRGDDDVTSR